MKKNRLRILILIIILFSQLNCVVTRNEPDFKTNIKIENSRQISFSGEVTRNQPFSKEIWPNLYFQLIPKEYGWDICIRNIQNLNEDYSGIATPPFYGINHLYIEGWHFRNSDNSGKNEMGEKNLNTPGEEREFQFVTNSIDYNKASNSLEKILHPGNLNAEEEKKAREVYDKIQKCKGSLTITIMELGNLKIGQQAWIKNMQFNVKINLP